MTDIMGVLLALWLVSLAWPQCCETKAPPPPPTSPPPEPPDLSTPPDVSGLKLFQSLAINRGDWRMADYYRDEAVRLVARHEAYRVAYNRALRTRILGEARARDYESTWKGNPHGEELS